LRSSAWSSNRTCRSGRRLPGYRVGPTFVRDAFATPNNGNANLPRT